MTRRRDIGSRSTCAISLPTLIKKAIDGEVNEVAALSKHPALRRVEVAAPHGRVSMAAPPGRDGPLGDVPALDAHGAALRSEFG